MKIATKIKMKENTSQKLIIIINKYLSKNK